VNLPFSFRSFDQPPTLPDKSLTTLVIVLKSKEKLLRSAERHAGSII
jgi:hypothetical protein